MKFELGNVVSTAGVAQWMYGTQTNLDFVVSSLSRHAKGDWGELCDEDKALNNEAVKEGNRILSAYNQGSDKIWIITESDRSCTTVLFPSEY